MIDQPSFFSRGREKRVTETSRESYAAVKPDLRNKYLMVLNGLEKYLHWKEHEPTAKELMEYMNINDPNEVRPRLSEMKDPEKGMHYVEASKFARVCTVTSKKVSTWKLTPRGEAFLKGQK